MRIVLTFMTISFLISNMIESQNLSLVDVETNEYLIEKYGDAWWMAENLRTQKDTNGNPVNFYFPNNDEDLIDIYGLLYDFETAQLVCPEGWRLPSNEDWNALFQLNKQNNAVQFKDNQFWNEKVNTNDSRFSARPAGSGNNGVHPNHFGEKTLFWSETKEEEHFIWTYILENGSDTIRVASQHPTYAFSVRCIK